MRMFGSISNFQWKDVNESASPENISKEKVRDHLSQRLQANNLTILLGAGASRAVKVDPQDEMKTAPLMKDIFAELQREVSNLDDIKLLVGCEGSDNFEEILSRCVLHEKIKVTQKITDFIETAKSKIVTAVNFLRPTSDLTVIESFLRCVTLRTSKDRSNIFTLNYDVTVEAAAARIGFTLIDGFSFNYPHQFSPLHFDYDIVRRKPDGLKPVESVAYLYKLHGSINWNLTEGMLVRTPAPNKHPCLIFPTKEKFQDSYNQPFLEMVTRFKEHLRSSQTTLLIIGYSCGDELLTQ